MRPLTTFALAALLALVTTACKKDKSTGSPEDNTPTPAADEKVPPAGAETAPTAATEHKGHRHEPSDPYYCPMHPEETAQKAGAKCPVCQMEMEPRQK